MVQASRLTPAWEWPLRQGTAALTTIGMLLCVGPISPPATFSTMAISLPMPPVLNWMLICVVDTC